MRSVTFLQPRRLTLGTGCLAECLDYLAALPTPRLHIVTSPSLTDRALHLASDLRERDCLVSIDAMVDREPTIQMFDTAMVSARQANSSCVLGMGGGSVLDLAKLVAVFLNSSQNIRDTFGIGLLTGRACHLVCVPTTSGTGSEVSPNAILLDEAAHIKRGVISPWLVPDATFIDPAPHRLDAPRPSPPPPVLTPSPTALRRTPTSLRIRSSTSTPWRGSRSVPASCFARSGTAVTSRPGKAMSRASLLGGLCLGPVNTAAVHALAYPLGGEFHLAHGLSNAILLPAVFRYNALASPDRHAAVAIALGARAHRNDLETALQGAELLAKLATDCGVDLDLAAHGLVPSDVPRMAASAMTVTRLLRNNPRELHLADAEQIYSECFAPAQENQ